jgi:hypothetical protein
VAKRWNLCGTQLTALSEEILLRRAGRAINAAGWLCCTSRVMDTCRESNVVAGPHEQTDIAYLQDHEMDCLQ